MGTSISLSKLLSVAVMGVLTAMVFAMILAPQPSLYAG